MYTSWRCFHTSFLGWLASKKKIFEYLLYIFHHKMFSSNEAPPYTTEFKIHWYSQKLTDIVYCIFTEPYPKFTVHPLYRASVPRCIPLYPTVQCHSTTLDSTVPTHWPALYTTVQGTYQHCTPLYSALTNIVHHCKPLYLSYMYYVETMNWIITSFKMEIWDLNLDFLSLFPIACKRKNRFLFL